MAKITVTKVQPNLTVTSPDGSKKLLVSTPIGIAGPRGDTGPSGDFGGPPGPTGNTGVGLSGATLVNYELILTLTSGQTLNVGYIRGETGPTGISGSGGCGGSLETLSPNPAGYYPYASIFIDQYGRVTGASGATDIASQSSLIQLFQGISAMQQELNTFIGTFTNSGIVGGTW